MTPVVATAQRIAQVGWDLGLLLPRPAAVRPPAVWATTLTGVYGREAAGDARNMGRLAGGWTCPRRARRWIIAWSS
jgi:hypothetical protein